MINNDIFEKEVPGSELGQIKAKYPQIVQSFEDVKKQAYEPQIQGLGQVQLQETQQRLKNLVQQERDREKAEERQGQTS